MFIYSYQTKVENLRVFYRHEAEVIRVIYLPYDKLAPVDEAGVDLTWRDITCGVPGKLQVSEY